MSLRRNFYFLNLFFFSKANDFLGKRNKHFPPIMDICSKRGAIKEKALKKIKKLNKTKQE